MYVVTMSNGDKWRVSYTPSVEGEGVEELASMIRRSAAPLISTTDGAPIVLFPEQVASIHES